MQIAPAEVTKIARLAKISIAEDEMGQYAKNLADIVAFVSQLNEAITDDIAPLAHPIQQNQYLRDDEVTETNCRDEFQSIAPEVADGLYLVPKVLD